MKNALTSSFIYILLISFFVVADFIAVYTYILVLPLIGFIFMFESFYEDNQKSFEYKDILLGLLFTLLAYFIYVYLNEPFTFDVFSTLTLIHTVVFVNIGCIHRYRILI